MRAPSSIVAPHLGQYIELDISEALELITLSPNGRFERSGLTVGFKGDEQAPAKRYCLALCRCIEVDRLRCSRCDWQGEKKETDSTEGGLIFYDILYRDAFNVEMSRMNYYCPKCGNMIESRRVIPGLPEDMTPQ
jgi:hypothetical protein